MFVHFPQLCQIAGGYHVLNIYHEMDMVSLHVSRALSCHCVLCAVLGHSHVHTFLFLFLSLFLFFFFFFFFFLYHGTGLLCPATKLFALGWDLNNVTVFQGLRARWLACGGSYNTFRSQRPSQQLQQSTTRRSCGQCAVRRTGHWTRRPWKRSGRW